MKGFENINNIESVDDADLLEDDVIDETEFFGEVDDSDDEADADGVIEDSFDDKYDF
jgi:hypothetical protein